jgi:hypothetical protein
MTKDRVNSLNGKIMEGRFFYPCANNCGRLTKDDGGFCVGCQNGIRAGILNGRSDLWGDVLISLIKIGAFVTISACIYKLLGAK